MGVFVLSRSGWGQMGRSGRGCTDIHPGDVGVYGIVDVLGDMLRSRPILQTPVILFTTITLGKRSRGLHRPKCRVRYEVAVANSSSPRVGLNRAGRRTEA